jgi:hypothetical protein
MVSIFVVSLYICKCQYPRCDTFNVLLESLLKYAVEMVEAEARSKNKH